MKLTSKDGDDDDVENDEEDGSRIDYSVREGVACEPGFAELRFVWELNCGDVESLIFITTLELTLL